MGTIPTHIRSTLGYPTAWMPSNPMQAETAKQQFFQLPHVNNYLKHHDIDLGAAAKHSFFVQGNGSDEIYVYFKEFEEQNPTVLILQTKDEPAYSLAYMAMTGCAPGQLPSPSSTPNQTPSPPPPLSDRTEALKPSEPQPLVPPKEPPKSSTIDDQLLKAIQNQQKDFMDFMTTQMSDLRKDHEQVSRNRMREAAEMTQKVQQMQTETNRLVHDLSTRLMTHHSNSEARQNALFDLLTQQQTRMQQEWIRFLERMQLRYEEQQNRMFPNNAQRAGQANPQPQPRAAPQGQRRFNRFGRGNPFGAGFQNNGFPNMGWDGRGFRPNMQFGW